MARLPGFNAGKTSSFCLLCWECDGTQIRRPAAMTQLLRLPVIHSRLSRSGPKLGF
jgi:hypothetical protein